MSMKKLVWIPSSCVRGRAALLILLAMSAPLMAQTARISGEVTDPSGRLVQDAEISVRNDATGIHRETHSTNSGTYDVPAIDPGQYSIRVTKSGFRPVERRGLVLFVDTNTRVDFQLKVGGSSDTITVQGDASMLQRDSPEMVTQVTSEQYNDLPMLQQGRDRSPAAFIFLAPGVQGNYTVSGAENTAATNQFTVNGSQMQVTEFFLDGAQVGQMRTVGSFNESAPNVEAIREFKITTTLLPSEYGHSGPAAGIFSVRSGTNQLHGGVYEYIRNNYFDAKPWGTVIPTYTRLNDFGAFVGGPVMLPHYNGRNRTFFFFSYGGGRKAAADSTQVLRVPTLAQDQGLYDTAKYYTIYDPNTTNLTAPGGPTRQIVPSEAAPNQTIQVIPPGEIDPAAKAIVAFLPAPNLNTTSTKDYQGIIGERLLNPDHFTVKIDEQLRPRHHISATYVGTDIPRNKVNTGLPAPLNSSSYQTVAGTTARLNYDWVIDSTKVNALVFGFNRFSNVETIPPGDAFPIPGIPGGKLPEITFTQSYPTFANDGNFNDVENNYQVRDVFRWQLGTHSLSAGGELRSIQFNDLSPQVPETQIGINDVETDNPQNTSRTGDAFASFLFGQVDSTAITYPYLIATRFKYAGAFVQDDWRVAPRLTLNLGLRWDVQTFPTEAHNHSSILSLTTPDPGTIGPGGTPLPGALLFAGSGPPGSGLRSFGITRYDGFGPRVGFVYAPTANILLRGGYGMFYSNPNNTISATGFQSAGSVQSPNNSLSPAYVLSKGLPTIPGLQPTLTPGLLNPLTSSTFQGASYIDSKAGYLPRIEQWNLGVQQSFGRDVLFELSYVGSHGYRLVDPQGVNLNQLDPKYLALGPVLTASAVSEQGQIFKLPTGESVLIRLPYQGFNGLVWQSLVPYPQYGTLTSLAAKVGYNNFHSLQAVLTKRVTQALTFSVNYVWSKNLGVSSPGTYGGGVVDDELQNAFDPHAEYSVLPIDVKHAFVAHYTYEFPFRHGHPWLRDNSMFAQTGNVLADGWKFSGVQRYQSGYPLSILTSNNILNPGGAGNRILRPNKVAGVDTATHASIHGFGFNSPIINYAAFSTPAPYTFGNAKPTYDDLRNFPILNEDFSLQKQTALRDHVAWILYLQTFNAFNRHRLTAFDTNYADGQAYPGTPPPGATNGTFGTADTPSQPRYVQLGTRFTF